MVQQRARRHNLDSLKAQYLVCTHLTRACRQAMFDIALDEQDDPAVRRRAIESLKAILADWADAQKWLRRELAGRNIASSFTRR